jgi:glycosyltransferase involved in cell wall biosynthesis
VTTRTNRISSSPNISLVVINWNQAGFVGDAITSIRHQDYAHFECFVVDNASEDDSRSAIAASIDGDKRFQSMFLDENLDQMGAFLHVFEGLSGPLIAVIDADDVLLPSYLSAHAQVHLCREIGLSSSGPIEIGGDGSGSKRHARCLRRQ